MRLTIKLKEEQIQVFTGDNISILTQKDIPVAHVQNGTMTVLMFNLEMLVYAKFDP